MVDPIPHSVRTIWEIWNIRGSVMFSLFLQTFLILFAPFRKRTSSKIVNLFIWLAYLLADATAIFAIGLIASRQNSPCPSAYPYNRDLLAFWAPFLLLHLGGPDTITAFALEDNELWLRHLLELGFQIVATGYVFILTLPKNKVIIPSLLLFIDGIIKYLERTCSLYLANTDKIRDSVVKEIVIDKPMDEYPRAMRELGIIVHSNSPGEVRRLNDLQVVQGAYGFFQEFKGLIVDRVFTCDELKKSRHFFNCTVAEDALQVIELELNFIYEMMFTKAPVLHFKLGYLLRFTSFSSVVAALAIFHFQVRKHGFNELDVEVTYALLFGAVGHDIIAFIMAFFSDWTMAFLKDSHCLSIDLAKPLFNGFLFLKKAKWYVSETDPKHTYFATSILFRRWSGSVFGHNLIRYSLRDRLHRMPKLKCTNILQYIIHYLLILKEKLIDWLGLRSYADEIFYVSEGKITRELWEFIFAETLKKSRFVNGGDGEKVKEIYSARGGWILQHDNNNCNVLLVYFIANFTYDESLLLWHIATELLYDTDENIREEHSAREFSKVLSDYMLYLLIMQPTMVAAAAGVGKILFRDGSGGPDKKRFENTLAEAKRFVEGRNLGLDEQVKAACRHFLSVNTDIRPLRVKGDRTKSLLFDACILAQRLLNLGEEKWRLLSKIWVEMLAYAASHYKGDAHVQQLSKGGELLTFVWLLISHIGLGDLR